VLVVSDIEATHGELVGRGIAARDVWHRPPFLPRPGNPASIRRAEAAHSEHAERAGHRLKAALAERVRDEDWPAWYASYMVAEQAGTDLHT
jgi:hypothetical protein